jgi:hypothetical protein
MQTMDKAIGEPGQPGQGDAPTHSAAQALADALTNATTDVVAERPVTPEEAPASEQTPAPFETPHVQPPSSAANDLQVEGQVDGQVEGQSNLGTAPGAAAVPGGPRRPRQSFLGGPEGPLNAYTLLALISIAMAVGVVMWAVAMREVLFNTNTATGGDMGAHVWTADFVGRRLVPQGRITGWSDDWFAGFPVLGFYFPFPFWLITILNVILPYNVAFKLITVSGLIAMPMTGYGLGHFAGLKKPLPVFCGLATLPFLMDQQYAIYGGNIKSTMAGEFSFAMSLALALLFLGLLARVMRTGERRATAAVVLAMVGLSHLLPTMWAGVAGTMIILTHLDKRRTNVLKAYAVFIPSVVVTAGLWVVGAHKFALVVGALMIIVAVVFDTKTGKLELGQFGHAFAAVAAGTALAMFWIWPFRNHLAYTNDMGYEKEQRYLWGLFPWTAEKPEASSAIFFAAFCLGLIGAVYCLFTFAKAVQRLVYTKGTHWYGWASAFCFATGFFVTAFFWNAVNVPRPGAATGTDLSWANSILSYTSLMRLLVFVFAVLVLHVLLLGPVVDDNWQRLGVAFVMVTATCAVTFRYIPFGFRLWNNRVLPFWLMGTYLLAGFGVYAIGRGISRLADLHTATSTAGRYRHGIAVLGGLVVTHMAIAMPLGLVPGWFPAPRFSKDTVSITKADGTTEEQQEGGWLIGLQQVKDSGDFDSSAAKGWPPYNYNGYEDRGAAWVDYKRITTKMGDIGKKYGCGRAHWEYESKQDRWGTPMALMLLPYWTDSCIQSMEGLYFESAATAPYHWLTAGLTSKAPSNPQRDLPYRAINIEVGVNKMQDLGIRYYMAFSNTAIEQADKNPNLKLLDTAPYERSCDDNEKNTNTCPTLWKIYQVKGADLVTPLTVRPAVATGIGQSQQQGWVDLGVAQFNDETRFPVPFVASVPMTPPKEWERVEVSENRDHRVNKEFGATVALTNPKTVPLTPVKVSNIKAASLGSGDDSPGSLSFSVDKTGVPVLIKMSYFPNFRVKGAKGPYRTAQNQMIVVPTSKNVSIEFKWDKNDYIGFASAIGGIGACIFMWQSDRRRRAVVKAAEIAEWRSQRQGEKTTV